MVCLITGSSRGLGKEIALESGRRGFKVVVHCLSSVKEAETVASGIPDSIMVRADVRARGEVEFLVDEVVKKWGRVDVLVNNAGITKESLVVRTGAEDFDEVIDTNLKGPFNLIRAVGRIMMKQRSGHIVNISSYAGVKGKEGLCAYAASKAGLIGLTKTAAKELSRYHVSVNAVLPGYMMTDMGNASSDKGKALALRESLIKEYSDPVSVAGFICDLIEMNGVTGQVFNIDSRIM